MIPKNVRFLDWLFFEVGVSSDLTDKDRPTCVIRPIFPNGDLPTESGQSILSGYLDISVNTHD